MPTKTPVPKTQTQTKKAYKGAIVGKGGLLINDYQFRLLPILANSETKKLFEQFLGTEYNLEPFHFVHEVDQLKKTIHAALPDPSSSFSEAAPPSLQDAVVKQANLIVSKFLLPGSSEEINVSAAIRDPVLDLLKPLYASNTAEESTTTTAPSSPSAASSSSQQLWPLKEVDPLTIFDELDVRVKLELERDSLCRFVRTEAFLSFIKTKEKAFVESVGSLKETLRFNYTTKDFIEPVVTDEDFEFATQIAEDSYDWEMQGYERQTKGEASIHGFWGVINYLPKVDWMVKGSVAKFVGVLPYNVDVVARALIPFYNVVEYDGNAVAANQMDYLTNQQLKEKYPSLVKHDHRSVCTLYSTVELPFPLNTKRRYMVASSIRFDAAKDQIQFVQKPCLVASKPLPRGFIEMKDFQFWTITKLDENKTQYVQIHMMNLGGYGKSQSLQKLVVWTRAKQIQKTFHDFMEKEQSGKGKPWNPTDDFYARLLADANVETLRKQHAMSRRTTTLTSFPMMK